MYFNSWNNFQSLKYNKDRNGVFAYITLDKNDELYEGFYISQKIKLSTSIQSLKNEFEEIWANKTKSNLILGRFTDEIKSVDDKLLNKWIRYRDLPENIQRAIKVSPLIYIEGFGKC